MWIFLLLTTRVWHKAKTIVTMDTQAWNLNKSLNTLERVTNYKKKHIHTPRCVSD